MIQSRSTGEDLPRYGSQMAADLFGFPEASPVVLYISYFAGKTFSGYLVYGHYRQLVSDEVSRSNESLYTLTHWTTFLRQQTTIPLSSSVIRFGPETFSVECTLSGPFFHIVQPVFLVFLDACFL